MRVITRGVIDWETLEVLEEESYEYAGPIALAKDSGSAPQPVDPYQQAAAQYGLDTGTASYNAALNRPNMVNPVGSTSWNVTGYSGGQPPAFGLGGGGAPVASVPPPSTGSSAPPAMAHYGTSTGANPLSSTGLTGPTAVPTTGAPGVAGSTNPYAASLASSLGSGAPLYTESTQFAPQFQSILQHPINTAGIPELSGENLTPQVQQTENAVFNQNMGYLAPEERLQSEGLNSQLAAEGLMPGSDAWNNEQARLGRQQTFENTQAASGAVTAGEQELSNLFGLGGQTLQSEIAYQNQPINEFNALQGGPAASATAQTPDISGAFNQQYQGQLAGYNANVASNNATEGELATLAALAYLAA